MGFCLMLLPAYALAHAEMPVDAGILQDIAEGALTMEGNVAIVRNLQGATLEVYDITGKRISATYVDSNEKRVTLNLRKGCYILKAGKLTRKIAVA